MKVISSKESREKLGSSDLGGGVYFNDPRLRMTIPGRLLVRVAGYIGYLVTIVATATFLLSDLKWLRTGGIFFLLFLLQRANHWGEADRSIYELPRAGRINLAKCLKPRAFSLIERAFDRSTIIPKQNFFLGVVHELLGFKEIREGLKRLDVAPHELKQKLEELSKPGADSRAFSKEELLVSAELLVRKSFEKAKKSRHGFIELSDLFSGLALVGDPLVDRLFNTFSIEEGDLELALIFGSFKRSFLRGLPKALGGFILGPQRIRHRIMNRAWTARPTPTLDRYSNDLTDLAKASEVGFLIGHKEEFIRLINTLARPVNPNALLVGEAGIGKETMVNHLAFRLAKDEVPAPLFDKRLVALALESLVAGAPPEELNRRLKIIIEEILAAGNIILYIPNIHNLVRTSGTAYLSAADALMPIIMNSAFPVIGATFPREFKQSIEPRSDFAGAFEAIRVQEISEEEAKKVLIYESLLLENQFRITISFGAVKYAVVLAKKYFRNKFLPSSAEELLKSALVEAKRRGEKFLGPERVVGTAESKVNIPIHEAGEEEAQKLLNLESLIHKRLIDQEEAVRAVADAIREYRSGLTRPGGPIASFLFVGPTGVGKTELAKILAKIQFGSEREMVRFDMTEYQDKQSFMRFIGSPDGTVTGALTEAILQKPYSLVLLDEFEKAYPDILNLFLQVFDDGRLTDNLGRVADFGNAIIIATSNAHSDIINDALSKGQSMKDIAEYLKKKLVDVFKPELLNRFSRVVVFKDLNPSDLEKIVALNLADVAGAVKNQGIELAFDPAVVKQFAKWGYDPAFGARPLRRVIDEKLRAPLAGEILKKKVSRGGSIKLILKGEKLEFVEG